MSDTDNQPMTDEEVRALGFERDATGAWRRQSSNGHQKMVPTARTSWTAAELMTTEFPEQRWAVPNLIAEGLNLLCGPPKLGKSWFALNLGVAIALGGRALGKIDVDQGDVLYLALEDTGRRLKSRLRTVLAGEPAPEGLTLETVCESLTDGGTDRIEAWLGEHPDARLVIVDVFTRVRGRLGERTNRYEADYDAMAILKDLADQHSVAFLVVHHTRNLFGRKHDVSPDVDAWAWHAGDRAGDRNRWD